MNKKILLTGVVIFSLTAIAVSFAERARAETSRFDLEIKAKIKGLIDGDAILVNGTTNLPPKTAIYLTLKTGFQTIVVRKKIIDGDSFTETLGPFDRKRFGPGLYMVEALFIPSRQTSDEVKKRLGTARKIITVAQISVGSAAEAEESIAKHKAELIMALKELDGLYGEMNLEYAAQKEKFNETEWNSRLDQWKARLKEIRTLDEDYRDKMIAIDYFVQEDTKMDIIRALDKLWVRYTEELFKANNLVFNPPHSDDNRDIVALNTALPPLLNFARKFIETSEKQEAEKPEKKD